jgi:hypothetical protein
LLQPPSLAGSEGGADDQNRTGDLVLTKDALCQLSYIGLRASRYGRRVGLIIRHQLRQPTSSEVTAGLPAVAANAVSVWRRLERETGIEPATNSLEGCDSTTELLPPPRSRASLARASAGKPAYSISPDPAWCARHFRLPIRPLLARQATPPPLRSWPANRSPPPRVAIFRNTLRWAKVGGEGRTRTFEAARATDLQSAAFDRFATSPTICLIGIRVFDAYCVCCLIVSVFVDVRLLMSRFEISDCASVRSTALKSGAGEGIRTPDLLITNQLLYRPELRQPKQKWNYSTSYATGTILVLSTIGGSRGRLTAALANGFEKRDPGGDRDVQALNVPPHRYRRQPVTTVPDQASQPTSLGPQHQSSGYR